MTFNKTIGHFTRASLNSYQSVKAATLKPLEVSV